MKEKRRKLDKSVELVSKKEVEWLVLNPVDVNRTHIIQINDHKLPKCLKELEESGEKVFIPLPKPSINIEKCKPWQEPIWSVQLPYSVCETAFSQVGLFLD